MIAKLLISDFNCFYFLFVIHLYYIYYSILNIDFFFIKMNITNIEKHMSSIFDKIDCFKSVYDVYNTILNNDILSYASQSISLIENKLMDVENIIDESYNTFQNFILNNYDDIQKIIDDKQLIANERYNEANDKREEAVKRATFMSLYYFMINDPNSFLRSRNFIDIEKEELENEIAQLNQK